LTRTRKALTVAALAMLAVPAAATAEPATHETTIIPLEEQTGVIDQTCMSEPVFMRYSGQLVSTVTETSSGRLNATTTFHVTYEGTGLVTGNRYVAAEHLTQGFLLDTTEGVPLIQVHDSTILWVSQGPAPNLLLHRHQVFVVNANGELTAQHADFDVRCVGGGGPPEPAP
jgi:hypothetical protein